MITLLSEYTESRDNNFNLIRFIAASLVLFSHSFALSIGTGDAEPLRQTIGLTWGVIAVDIFFITSGFLITRSYLSKRSLASFILARLLRIYPALIVAMFFCAFVIGLISTSFSTKEYLASFDTYSFFFKNSTLIFGLETRLPGVFSNVPYKGAVNGSLWTLPYEIFMYSLLAIAIGLLGYITQYKIFNRFEIKKCFLLICIFSVLLNFINYFYHILPTSFLRLFSMFFIGATYYYWKDNIKISSYLYLYLLGALLISAFNQSAFFITFILSFLSWHFIEERFLQMKKVL